MEVKLNILELSSELAEMELIKFWDYRDGEILEEDEHETRYTETAQNIFNDLYDKYYFIILNLSTNL